MSIVYKLVLVLLLGVIVVFSFQNIATVTVSFLTWTATVPLAMVVIAAYILGAVTGGGVLSLLMRSIHDDTRK
ncbi:MAG: hypothetical protein KatS3mg082_1841 [Nitrospiraceae bacterium]|nr:MAG: hypothetical protein KatS3mg082_1841 [Nitrospiraceae bacterium]